MIELVSHLEATDGVLNKQYLQSGISQQQSFGSGSTSSEPEGPLVSECTASQQNRSQRLHAFLD
jgi:hypothetical protein